MPTLNLAVLDIPYESDGVRPEPKLTKKGGVRKSTARRLQRLQDGHDTHADAPATTVSVATILQEKYGLFSAFYERHKADIGQAVVNSLEGTLEDLYAGSPIHDPFAQASQEIDKEFRTFLMTAEIEAMGIEGVPTKAALERRSGRFKSKKGPEQRPSFVDTGTLEASLKSFIS